MNNSIFSPLNFKPKAVVIDNGEYPTHKQPLKWMSEAPYIICCDGAANRFLSEGGKPNIIIGDGDSIDSDNKLRSSIPFLKVSEQEDNDQTKAVTYLASKGMTHLLIVGGTGKREDHTLGNISLLVEYLKKGITALMSTDYGIFIPCRDDMTIASQKGQQISIINFDAIRFSSERLVYPLPSTLNMWWQGTLNEAETDSFTIHAKGYYLIFLNYLA